MPDEDSRRRDEESTPLSRSRKSRLRILLAVLAGLVVFVWLQGIYESWPLPIESSSIQLHALLRADLPLTLRAPSPEILKRFTHEYVPDTASFDKIWRLIDVELLPFPVDRRSARFWRDLPARYRITQNGAPDIEVLAGGLHDVVLIHEGADRVRYFQLPADSQPTDALKVICAE